ncbi:GGDEF domain-containing protein [Saccharopolyspora mangrovi]|uniref:GGDEF domain-containing protein n=1 Tax=Saccharopolyspora mangrovi TaxID=3082379 RepID=A0ABU6AIN0_9PSEU|nr:GGDEF domain-containing protein [Saccharopolyspora sp. S2-29]MEB3371308.1 GGDEF domain-containing protein [Saccharopolyspora sp. S2-29]
MIFLEWRPAAPLSSRSTTALGAAAATAAAGWMLTATRLHARTRQLHRAHHDPVTGLLTRAAFEPAAQAALRHRDCTVGLVDLDGFKAVNDTHGHKAGDEVLRAVATRLKTQLGHLAVVGRIGGDELAFVTRGLRPGELDMLVSALTTPIPTNAGLLQVGVSLGISTLDRQATLSDALVAADLAMYEAKSTRQSGGWRVCSPRSHAAALPALCPAPRQEAAVGPATQEVNQR